MNSTGHLLVFVSLMLFSCKNTFDTGNDSVDRSVSTNEKLIKYYHDTSEINGKQPFLRHLTQVMGLTKVPDNIDGFYIRIWLWDLETNYVIDMAENADRSACNIVQWSFISKDSSWYVLIRKEWENLTPRSGGAQLSSDIRKYGIFTLTGAQYLIDKFHNTGGANNQFEIFTKHSTSFYEYFEPSYYRYVDSGAMNAYNFLLELNDHLGIECYQPLKESFLEPNR